MQEIYTDWKDGDKTLVATIEPQRMVFLHNEEQVAQIDADGNLCIRGQLFELTDPKLLTLVHANTSAMQIWRNPVVMYDGKQMSAFLVQDQNVMYDVSYPAFFWDDKDFYVWGKLETSVAGPDGSFMQLSSFDLEGFGVYTKTSIRGIQKSGYK